MLWENNPLFDPKKLSKLLRVTQVRSFLIALIKYHTAASIEHLAVLRHLADQHPKLVIDIGANRGQFALAARKCFPDAKIVSFEPLKEPASSFRRLFSSDPKVSLHEIAIGPDDKRTIIHVSHADDSSSLLPIGTRQSELFPGTQEREQRIINVRSLDGVICREDMEETALLKIDVQGFEKEVLDGCKALLPYFSHIYIECSFVELYCGQALAHEIISFLSKSGFVLSGIYNLYYDKTGIAIQGDFLFKNKNISI
jgi:FkbM family methyltransferase